MEHFAGQPGVESLGRNFFTMRSTDGTDAVRAKAGGFDFFICAIRGIRGLVL
jgi:hypothetical protein